MNADEDEFDLRLAAKLGRELRQQLDPQLGRAAPYFLTRCATSTDVRRGGRGRRGRFWAGVAAVAATCCAVLVALDRARPPALEPQPNRKVVAAPAVSAADEPGDEPSADQESPGNGDRMSAAEPLVLGRALSSRTLDEGTLLVGRTPVRKVRRQWLERVEWFDPQNGARLQRIVPREEVLFVPLPIN